MKSVEVSSRLTGKKGGMKMKSFVLQVTCGYIFISKVHKV